MPDYICSNDSPTLNDSHLGSKHFIERMIRDIQHSTPPKTFAITGYWGSGKTSALAMLYQQLTNQTPPGFASTTTSTTNKKEDHIGIWFEAWRYQHESVPIVALLQTIKSHFATTDKLVNKAGKLASVALLGALTVIDGVIKAASGLSGFNKIQAVGEKYEKDNLLSLLASDQINDALAQAIDVILNNSPKTKTKKKLVIFIDDLDRCEPDTAFSLLEGLKLYLNVPNCIVVMALDPQQIETSLVKKLGDSGDSLHNKFYPVEYMEKLCQDAHRLPVPNAAQRNQFLLSQLKPSLSTVDGTERQPIDDLAAILNRFDCLPANPRRLKMLANRMAAIFLDTQPEVIKALTDFCELENITENTRDEIYTIAVLVVASLAVNYRRLYERLEKSKNFVDELFEFSNSASSDFDAYQQPQSVFYEFDQTSDTTEATVKHPSDLGVFRLRTIFKRGGTSVQENYQLAEQDLGAIMHQLIEQYNHPSALTE